MTGQIISIPVGKPDRVTGVTPTTWAIQIAADNQTEEKALTALASARSPLRVSVRGGGVFFLTRDTRGGGR